MNGKLMESKIKSIQSVMFILPESFAITDAIINPIETKIKNENITVLTVVITCLRDADFCSCMGSTAEIIICSGNSFLNNNFTNLLEPRISNSYKISSFGKSWCVYFMF